jgi:hypothetical protein
LWLEVWRPARPSAAAALVAASSVTLIAAVAAVAAVAATVTVVVAVAVLVTVLLVVWTSILVGGVASRRPVSGVPVAPARLALGVPSLLLGRVLAAGGVLRNNVSLDPNAGTLQNQ